jgi:Raf kinase inhibitor-like YbhB/YbcL family protein
LFIPVPAEVDLRNIILIVLTLVVAESISGCAVTSPKVPEGGTNINTVFQISSSAFNAGARIPAKYTADGAGISPPLSWDNTPEGTKSLALILDDPDAPIPGGFTHWVLFNIPADQLSLSENISSLLETLPNGGMQGSNGAGKLGYRGPAPPLGGGIHHYRFNLYALNRVLDLEPGATKDQLLAAMEGHMVGNAIIVGIYSR